MIALSDPELLDQAMGGYYPGRTFFRNQASRREEECRKSEVQSYEDRHSLLHHCQGYPCQLLEPSMATHNLVS